MTDPNPSPFETGELTTDAYAAFIGQIELRAVWLQSARLINHHGPSIPEQVGIALEDSAGYDALPSGFRVRHTYTLRAESGDLEAIEIEVTFALDFESRAPMTEAIFSVFAGYNLPVNSWPFLREFVFTTVARMGWLPITLPTLKRGTPSVRRAAPAPPASRVPAASPSRTRRSRKKATSAPPEDAE